jgi:hypothetical protein
VLLEGLGKLKKCNELVGNSSRDLPTHINTMCAQNAEFLDVKKGDICT